MSYINKEEYIKAYSKIMGVSIDKVREFVNERDFSSLIKNPYILLKTKNQRERFDAFKSLYNMSEVVKKDLKQLTCPKDVADFSRSLMPDIDNREAMIVIYTNTRKEVIGHSISSIGSVDFSTYHPRDIFKGAVLENATDIFVVHNHPAETLEPSYADKRFTKKILEASRLMEINLGDSLIITGYNKSNYYSFKEAGMMDEIKKELAREKNSFFFSESSSEIEY